MTRIVRLLAAAALVALAGALAGCGGGGPAAEAPAQTAAPPAPADRGPSLLTGTVRSIDGEPVPLRRFAGGPVLVVNTASRCGFTPQFEGLERLYRERRGEGLTVVGFPSADFRQELDGDEEIADFCRLRYGVSFPMMAASAVTGPGANPLFRAIAARPGPAGEEPSWNFTKYLLDGRGRLVARFPSSVEPGDPRIAAAIDALAGEAPL